VILTIRCVTKPSAKVAMQNHLTQHDGFFSLTHQCKGFMICPKKALAGL